MTGAVWRPTFIDIEPEFNKFVPTFRNGKLVRDLVPDQPDMALNADYYFPDDHVIAELKCMETDSEDSYPQRVSEAFTHFRYSGSDLMGFLFRGEPNGAQKSAMWHCPRKRTFTRSAAFGNWALRVDRPAPATGRGAAASVPAHSALCGPSWCAQRMSGPQPKLADYPVSEIYRLRYRLQTKRNLYHGAVAHKSFENLSQ